MKGRVKRLSELGMCSSIGSKGKNIRKAKKEEVNKEKRKRKDKRGRQAEGKLRYLFARLKATRLPGRELPRGPQLSRYFASSLIFFDLFLRLSFLHPLFPFPPPLLPILFFPSPSPSPVYGEGGSSNSVTLLRYF